MDSWVADAQALERLEQMRALEAGMHIAVGEINCAPRGVDTEADLRAVQSDANDGPAELALHLPVGPPAVRHGPPQAARF